MAKSDNFFNLKGKVGKVIFCERNGKTYVKTYSGGFVNGNSNQHPNTKAVQNRFKEVSKFAKELKAALTPIIWKQKDATFYNHLVSIFSKIKKEAPNQDLYTAFLEGNALKALKNYPLNKHSVLPAGRCFMDHTNDKVIIEPGFVYQVMEKYPEASLEINTAWLTLTQELTLRLVEIQTQYLEFRQIYLTQYIAIEMKNTENMVNVLKFPILSVNVVNEPNKNGRLFHENAYSLVVFL